MLHIPGIEILGVISVSVSRVGISCTTGPEHSNRPAGRGIAAVWPLRFRRQLSRIVSVMCAWSVSRSSGAPVSLPNPTARHGRAVASHYRVTLASLADSLEEQFSPGLRRRHEGRSSGQQVDVGRPPLEFMPVVVSRRSKRLPPPTSRRSWAEARGCVANTPSHAAPEDRFGVPPMTWHGELVEVELWRDRVVGMSDELQVCRLLAHRYHKRCRG